MNARRSGFAHRRPQAPRVSRLRLGRHRHEQRPRPRDAQGQGQDLDARERRERQARFTARSASRTRAGPRTAQPNECNAHPHIDCTDTIAVVHNGIIENSAPLRKMLQMQGHTFKSETDTEVLAHLIEAAFDGELEDAVIDALNLVEGTYGIAVISSQDPGQDRRARARAARCSSASATASTTSRATSPRFSSTRARSSISTTARWAC